MKNFSRKVVKTFKRLADAAFLAFGKKVSAAMALAVTIFPNPTPALADLDAELLNFSNLLELAANRDKVQVVLKNKSKKLLMAMLSQLCDYVNLVCQSDESLLVLSSMDLNKIPEPITMKAPSRLRLGDGINSGEITIKFKGPRGATGYNYQYTTDPQLAENSWENIQGTTTNYLLTGLTRGSLYFCRVIAVGGNLQRTTSIVVNRVSQ